MSQEFKVIASADVANLEKGMSDARKSLAQTAVSAQKLDSSLGNMAKGSNQATTAMGNFSRIVQDAPFGIIGITNNINPLLESFQRLKAETGSSGAAFKALGASLIGGGGLGLAVSVVTSLLTVFALSARSSGDSAEDLSGKIAALKVDFDNAKNSADGFSASVDSLRALRDVNLSIRFPGDGKNALDRLKLSFGFNKVEEEEKLRQLLRLEQVAEDKRANLFSLLQQKGSRALNDLVASQNTLNDVKKIGNDLSSKDLQLLDAVIDAENAKVKIQADQGIQRNKINQLVGQNKLDIDEINKKEAERLKNIRTISDVLNELSNKIKVNGEKNSLIGTEKTKANISAIEAAIDELLKKFKLGTKNKIILDLAFRFNKATFDILSDEFLAREIEGMKDTPKRTLIFEPRIVVKPRLVFESANFTKEMTDQLQKAVDITASSLLSITTSAITSVLEGIANLAMGKGGIGDIFQGLAKVLGSGVKQFGKQVLELALLAKLAKLAIKNPITGIAAGIALIALGAAIEAATSKNAFATGVRDFTGGTALVGERGPELVSLPKGSSVHTNGQLNAMGGKEIKVSGELRAQGTELVAVFKQATLYNSRNGF